MSVRRALIPLAAAGGFACTAAAQSTWRELPALEARRTGVFAQPDLSESSGVAVSRRRAGLLWSLSDSGNDASLHASDTTGRDLGTVRVAGAENRDWEALAAGPCPGGTCLYIADTGDNGARQTSVRLYRVVEPQAGGNLPRSVRAETLRLRHREGAQDVEAMFVDADGGVHLISKGRHGPVRHWRVDPGAWRTGTAVLEARGTLPIAPDPGRGRLVTDAALAPGGTRAAVRTYREIFFFHLTAAGRLLPEPTAVACGLGLLEVQGEGLDWLDEDHLVTTSEALLGGAGTVSVVRCPR